jgi:hypothetical protein
MLPMQQGDVPITYANEDDLMRPSLAKQEAVVIKVAV